jgi:glycerol-3-phosphate dehydrogenase
MPKHNLFSKRGSLAIRAGLQLYRWMSNEDSLQTSFRFEQRLDTGAHLSLFDYEDAQCEFPERLAAEWLAEAAYAGARVRNHAKVLDIKKSGHHFTIRFRDSVRSEEARIFSDCVVNASGPWVNDVCIRAFAPARPLVQGVRGSHIIINRFPDAPSHAVYTEAPDKRPFFVVPWNEHLLIGTTEIRDDNDPAEAKAAESEIQYLIEGFNRLFSLHPIGRSDVLAYYSGIRALPARGTQADLGAVTRRSFIHDHHEDGLPGMYSLIGGKLTTAASLARQCARALGVKIQEEAAVQVALGPSSGFENTLQQWSRQAARLCSVSEDSAQATAEWHGRCAFSVLRRASYDKTYATPIVDGTHHLVAECVHAFEREFAVTLGDVLLRRVPIALNANWSSAQSAQAAFRIGEALGWSTSHVAEELEKFEAERKRFLHPAGARAGTPIPAEHAA